LIEKDRRLSPGLETWLVHPFVERRHPVVEGTAEGPVLGDDAGVTARDAGLLESQSDRPGELEEIPVHRLEGLVVQVENERMVLVGDHRLLAPCRAAQRQPCPRDRGRPQPLHGKRDEALGQRIDHQRDQAADVDRIRTVVHEIRDGPRQILAGRGNRRCVGRRFDARSELERLAPAESQ
jgi:hypothetical protein